MKLYDVSMPIHENIPVYNNNEAKKPVLTVERDFEGDSGVRETRLSINLHTGTHMDAPLHMIKGGLDTSCFRFENMITLAKVIDLTFVNDAIKSEDIKDIDISEGDFIIFKTRNSSFEGFDPNFVFIEISAANYLASKKIKGVGIDALGIERSQPGHPSHKTLLSADVAILEGLRLKDVPEGEYVLIAAPLNIQNVEAAPVRALLADRNYILNIFKGENPI